MFMIVLHMAVRLDFSSGEGNYLTAGIGLSDRISCGYCGDDDLFHEFALSQAYYTRFMVMHE